MPHLLCNIWSQPFQDQLTLESQRVHFDCSLMNTRLHSLFQNFLQILLEVGFRLFDLLIRFTFFLLYFSHFQRRMRIIFRLIWNYADMSIFHLLILFLERRSIRLQRYWPNFDWLASWQLLFKRLPQSVFISHLLLNHLFISLFSISLIDKYIHILFFVVILHRISQFHLCLFSRRGLFIRQFVHIFALEVLQVSLYYLFVVDVRQFELRVFVFYGFCWFGWSDQVGLVASVHLLAVFDVLYAADELLLIQFCCTRFRHKVVVQFDFWFWFLQWLCFINYGQQWIDLVSIKQASNMNIFLRCRLCHLWLLIFPWTFRLDPHLLRLGRWYFVETLFDFGNQRVLLQSVFEIQLTQLLQHLDRIRVPQRLLLSWLQTGFLSGLSAL